MRFHKDELIRVLKQYRKGSNFGQDFLDEDVQTIWISRLKHYPMNQIRVALNALAGKREFPTVDAVVFKICKQQLPDGEEVFNQLWSRLDRRNPPKNVNVILAKTIEAFGWQVMCDVWLEATRDKHRRDFMKEYDSQILKAAQNMAIGGGQIALESTQDVGMGICLSEKPAWEKAIEDQIEREKAAMQSVNRSGGENGEKKKEEPEFVEGLLAELYGHENKTK